MLTKKVRYRYTDLKKNLEFVYKQPLRFLSIIKNDSVIVLCHLEYIRVFFKWFIKENKILSWSKSVMENLLFWMTNSSDIFPSMIVRRVSIVAIKATSKKSDS